MPWTTGDVLAATGGRLVCGSFDQRFGGIGIDSRTIDPQALFIAIRGGTHDGHCFVADVTAAGVQGVLIETGKAADLPCDRIGAQGGVCIAVADTTRALGDLAAYHRRRHRAGVVAITGSNGKTSTRTMTTAVVARRFETLSPAGNFNNEIGLPLTLLNLTARHRWAVVELGMNHFGEIRRLAEICLPDIGMITNIGPAHLEGLGSIDGVMRAKAELLEKIKPEGTLVLNADDPRTRALARKSPQPVILFGLGEGADIRGKSIVATGQGNSFTLELPGESITVALRVHGDFMVVNALAAAAVGYRLGLPAREIKAGLESFRPVGGRMRVLETALGLHIIDDTYNANPGSMASAIQTVAALSAGKPAILVAGDMLELGDHAVDLHEKIGRAAARAGIDRLYVTGGFAEATAQGARKAGMAGRRIFIGRRRDIIADLKTRLAPGDWLLIKGSRGMALETVTAAIRQWADAGGTG